MAKAQGESTLNNDPGPTLFVLFGATGDLAKRMVIPAFYTLACAGLLPKDWLLVGNGRGNLAHEDFRAHAHEALTQFGPHPAETSWRRFSKRLLFAGGGFDSNDPGSMLDVVGHARRHRLEGRAARVVQPAPTRLLPARLVGSVAGSKLTEPGCWLIGQ